MQYEKYKTIKKEFDFKYRGIKINQILAVNIWEWSLKKGVDNINIRNQWKTSLDFSFLYSYKKDHIMFFDVERKDHQRTFFDIAEKVKDVYDAIDASGKIFEHRYVSIANLLIALYRVFFSGLLFSFSFKEKLKIASYLCFILNSIDELYKTSPKPVKRYVAYSAIHPWENLLCQYYKLKGAKTFGLSHGLFPLFKKNIPIDCLNYENLDVDCCLVWGEMSKDVYKEFGINEDKLAIAGYPKSIKLSHVFSSSELKRCLVLLSRQQFDEANISLVKLLSKFSNDIKFELKLHPSCDFKHFSQYAQEYDYSILDKTVLLTDCMNNEKYDFAIAVNTSTYYEIMAAGIPCMRFDHGDDYDLMYGDEHDRVSTEEDFRHSLEWMRSEIANKEYDKKVQNILVHALGLGIDEYRKILLD